MNARVIRIVCGVIGDAAGRTLLVRKRGASVFQQPGGKRDAGDAGDLATLARELHEELGCEIEPGTARFLCRCRAPAANEPGCIVEAEVYTVTLRGTPAAAAEIAELHWIDPASPDVPVARLSREHILPQWREHTQGEGNSRNP